MKTEGLLRFDFANIKRRYNKLGKGAVRLTQSTLFFMQKIDGTKSAYSFPVLENDNSNGGINPHEIRLNQNDEFVMTSMGFFLVAQKYTGGVEAPVVLVGGQKLLTYAPIEAGAATDTLTPMYDGFARIGVNNIVFVDKWGTRKCEKVQRTQWNNQIAVGLNGATSPSFEADSDGLVVLAPTVTLSGAKKNEISLILPEAMTPATFTFTGNDGVAQQWRIDYIGLRTEGLLAQNAAQFQTASLKGARK
jgi:hypothetical protein